MNELIKDVRAFEREMGLKYGRCIEVKVSVKTMSLGDLLDVVNRAYRHRWNRMGDIRWRDRSYPLIRYRHLFFVRAREYGYGLQDIGDIIGVTHATVLNGIHKTEIGLELRDVTFLDVAEMVDSFIRKEIIKK